MLGALPLFDVLGGGEIRADGECGACEVGGGRGGGVVKGVDRGASQSSACLFGE